MYSDDEDHGDEITSYGPIAPPRCGECCDAVPLVTTPYSACPVCPSCAAWLAHLAGIGPHTFGDDPHYCLTCERVVRGPTTDVLCPCDECGRAAGEPDTFAF